MVQDQSVVFQITQLINSQKNLQEQNKETTDIEDKMTAKSTTEVNEQEKIVDNLGEQPIAAPSEAAMDMNKLAALKAKMMNKPTEQTTVEVEKPEKKRSLNFGIVGSGQAGGRLALAFQKLNYTAIAINTTTVDLDELSLPKENKLLLKCNALGGAAGERHLGALAAETFRTEISQLVNDKLNDSQVNILCTSLGGGSGSGSVEVAVDVLAETGKPLLVFTVLPMSSEDVQLKSNALATLSDLTKLVNAHKISNLVVIDNAKLESILSDSVSQLDFFDVANKMVVDIFDEFNVRSCTSSPMKGIDSMEWSKIICDSNGLCIFGSLTISNFREETAIAEGIINNLNSNLLASGFDLKSTKYAAIMLEANREVFSALPTSSVNYALSILSDICGTPKSIYKGIYPVVMAEPVIKVFFIFSGLALPVDRIEGLKKETIELQNKVKEKETQRPLNLQLNAGAGNETINEAQKVKDKIAAKNSAFGKLSQTVVDRRK